VNDRVTIVVDARNVLRSQWPNILEAELVERCCAWAAERNLLAIVVFDGRAPSANAAAAEPCRVIGTGDESADDWIAREAAALAARGEPYWLVTSDRELRERAGREAVRVIGGGAFADELRPRRLRRRR
jgi:predicted RNA-binding protein with PIN domain